MAIALICADAVDAEETPAVPPEEYALLSALLRHGLDPATKQAVIADTTTGDPTQVASHSVPLVARAQELNTTPELLAKWSNANQDTFTLLPSFTLPVPYALFSEGDRDMLFRGDAPLEGWKLFFARYPDADGFVRLSRAAFDESRTHALVYLEFQCGAECGSGRLVHLALSSANEWRVEGGELIWIAAPPP